MTTTFRDTLLEWNRRGLIQGPDESEEAFFKRCQGARTSESPSSSKTKELFDLDPDWVSISYDNKNLRLWEGGCAWIEGAKVSLQLKKHFEKSDTYLGLYSKEELIAHEYVHAARVAFEEPIFEEMLAYQTSKSPFRTILGPIFRTSSETKVLVFSFILLFFTALFTPFQLIAWAGALGLFGVGFFRLFRTRQLFNKTHGHLVSLVGQKHALAVMMRLTDREITRFASMDPSAILAYASKMTKTRLRWQQIVYAYFSPLFSQNSPETEVEVKKEECPVFSNV